MNEEEYAIYTGFASVYDIFMDNIPYDDWCDYLISLLRKSGVQDGLVVDLACGTGIVTTRLAQAGYDMIGIDFSEEMLEIAREKSNGDILFLQQDMREMELYGTVAAMVCLCDGMNYILEPQDLQQVFTKANNYLDPGGVLIFDLKTKYFYKNVLGNRMIAENREDASFLWDNEYHQDTGINEYLLTVYQLEDEEQDLFSRCDEVHYQKAYEQDEVQQLLQMAGMELVAVYDAFTMESPKEDSERIYIVAREKYQEGKYYNE